MSTLAEKLEAIAAEIEEHPERWTQGAFARDEDGEEVEGDPEESRDCFDDDDDPAEFLRDAACVCWCAFGFGYRAGLDNGGEPLLKAALKVSTPIEVAQWNDAPERKPAEVAALFRKAAEIAKASA